MVKRRTASEANTPDASATHNTAVMRPLRIGTPFGARLALGGGGSEPKEGQKGLKTGAPSDRELVYQLIEAEVDGHLLAAHDL